MKKPFLIVLDGPMGSGKTTISEMLHKKLKYSALLSLDRFKRLVSGFKLDSMLHLELASKIGRAMIIEYLNNNVGVIVEKAFTREVYLKQFLKGLNRRAEVFIYQLHSPLELRIKRIKDRPLPYDTNKKPSLAKIKRNSKHFDEFRYKKAREFDTSKLSATKIVNEILKEIK